MSACIAYICCVCVCLYTVHRIGVCRNEVTCRLLLCYHGRFIHSQFVYTNCQCCEQTTNTYHNIYTNKLIIKSEILSFCRFQNNVFVTHLPHQTLNYFVCAAHTWDVLHFRNKICRVLSFLVVAITVALISNRFTYLVCHFENSLNIICTCVSLLRKLLKQVCFPV